MVFDDGSLVEGCELPCDPGLTAGRRMPAFGLKADFLFSILSIHCPAVVVFATEGIVRSRALPKTLSRAMIEAAFSLFRVGPVPGKFFAFNRGVWGIEK